MTIMLLLLNCSKVVRDNSIAMSNESNDGMSNEKYQEVVPSHPNKLCIIWRKGVNLEMMRKSQNFILMETERTILWTCSTFFSSSKQFFKYYV